MRATKKFANGLTLLLLLLVIGTYAQTANRKELEEKRKKQQQEIELTKKTINEVKSKQKKSLHELQVLSTQINKRQQLIETTSKEIDLIEEQISELNNNIDFLNAQLKSLKQDYAKMIYISYKTKGSYDKMAFVFSSSNFNQAYKRLKYLQQFGDYRKKQLEEIAVTEALLKNRVAELGDNKESKEVLVVNKEGEKKELEQDKQDEAKLLTQLKSKEAKLRKELKEKEESMRKLNRAIADIIAREIEEERRRAEAENKKRNAETDKSKTGTDKKDESKYFSEVRTAENMAMSADFETNKNRLPWPVDKGFVVRPFGTHKHPTLAGVITQNNGVDIVTQQGSKARSVFKGEVRAVFAVPGMGKAVMINHGEYYSVYCNLADVTVQKGQKVKTGDYLGNIITDEEESKTEIHLEIWKGTEKQDPESWLR